MPDFDYDDRIGLACFLHGNGLRDPDKALTIFQFYNQYWKWGPIWKKKFMKFQAIFRYLDQMYVSNDEGLRIRSMYYYYSIELKLTLFYDGMVRTPNGSKRFYYDIFNKK